MIQQAKSVFRKTPLYSLAQRWRKSGLYIELARAGHLVAPPYEVKRLTIRLYRELYGPRTFVETGTYLGDTVEAVRGDFERIYSVELHPELARDAQNRFAGDPNIRILQGDSAELLPGILREVEGPCLLWLDGHYSSAGTARGSKDTPILEELAHVFRDRGRDHVILIDDARLFDGRPDYPKIAELRRVIHGYRPDYLFEVSHDIIRAAPRTREQ